MMIPPTKRGMLGWLHSGSRNLVVARSIETIMKQAPTSKISYKGIRPLQELITAGIPEFANTKSLHYSP